MLSVKKPLGHLLIIDDDADLLDVIRDYYRPRGYKVDLAESAFAPLEMFRQAKGLEQPCDVIICDLKMPRFDGLEFIREMRQLSPTTPIILMTAHSSVELAVQAVREGAYDFVNKPLNFAQLTVAIERALSLRKIQHENESLRSAVLGTQSLDGMVARSAAMVNVINFVRRVANSEASVLIQGESGTGKEVVAKAIHAHSPRKNGPYVAINCSAIPENLLESELFGYAKGAYTGADDKKIGLFEEANGGTLFLDEIGDLSPTLQAKLLRVLQERSIKRLGENQFRDINVRILAATHKNLEQEVQRETFRQDLYFRLNVIRVDIPPLRTRREDILPLADLFLKKFSIKNNVVIRGFSKEAQEFLYAQEWPGNVRELENAVERAVILCQTELIEVRDLPALQSGMAGGLLPSQQMVPQAANSSLATASSMPQSTPAMTAMGSLPPMGTSHNPASIPGYVLQASSDAPMFLPLEGRDYEDLPSLNDVSLDYVQFVLKKAGGVRERAARILDIDRKTLYRKIDEYRKRVEPKEPEVPASKMGESLSPLVVNSSTEARNYSSHATGLN